MSFFVRLSGFTTVFVAVSVLLARLVGSPLAPVFPRSFGAARLSEQVLAIGWWLLGARLAVFVARGGVAAASPSREARVLSDLISGAIGVAAILSIIAFVFALPVGGLLATSGVLAIVLGLALQSTLGDLFAGIAVGIERPYSPGDTLTVDGITGTVTGINWRSTHLLVGRDVAVVPNSTVARGRLLNRSAPSLPTLEMMELGLDPTVNPEDALVVLDAALRATAGIAPGFEPGVTCTALGGDRTTFTLRFTVPDSDASVSVRSALLLRVHRHLRFAGMRAAVQGTQWPEPADGLAAHPAGIEHLLTRSALFGAMEEPHRALLAHHFDIVDLAVGERIFTEGDKPEALFIIAVGTLEMITGPADVPTTCYRLSPGETMAAVALITGQPQRATARAVTAARVFRLGERALAACVAEAPGLEADLEQTVDRAMRSMARQHVIEPGMSTEQPDAFSHRLRAFLQRLRIATPRS